MAISTIGTNSLSDPIAVNATGALTGTVNGYTPTASNMQPFNRIINGAMTIDQRNAGANYTNSNQALYGLDRWKSYGITSAVLTIQQSTTAPAGFSNSLSVTVTTSTTANDSGGLSQFIEGNNAFDFGWGTSSGVAVTASFWVRASVIGTYNIYLRYLGSTTTYYYVATYTVNVANTWEQKTLNIPAAPVGAGAFTAALNSFYLEFRSPINSSGNTNTVAANTWSATNGVKTTGSVDLASNSGATFYITGVQLEAGSTASPFAHEFVGDTLQKCMRYYHNTTNLGNQMLGTLGYIPLSNLVYRIGYEFPVTMRATPTVIFSNMLVWDGGTTATGIAFSGNFTNTKRMDGDYTTNGGLTVGRYGKMYNGQLFFDAEL